MTTHSAFTSHTRPPGTRPTVRVVSDGTAAGTVLTVDGKSIPGIVALKWECTTGNYATATLEIENVEIDAVGDLTEGSVQA